MKIFFTPLSICFSIMMLLMISSCKNKTSTDVLVSDVTNHKNDLAAHLNQEKELKAYSGIVMQYQNKNNACFFVIPDMVNQGITESLGNNVSIESCTNAEYGQGAFVNFSELKKESYYPKPPDEGILIDIKGYWKTQNVNETKQIRVFYVTEYSPFF